MKFFFSWILVFSFFLPHFTAFAELSVGERKQRFLQMMESDPNLVEYVKDGKIEKLALKLPS